MASQDIIVVYKAEVNQLTQRLDQIIAAQQDIIKGTEEANRTIAKGLTTQEFAAKKRAQLIKAEELEIKKLTQLKKLAYDPKLIEDYNKRIADSQKKIQLLGQQTAKSLGGVNSVVQSIGRGLALGIGGALSADAIINFSKASVNAFLEAQKNAEKLKFAITQIGGESEAVFEKLLDQSKELQKVTIFSDDSIQAAQAALTAFGLTGAEIERLIPKLTDFATVTGKSMEEAAQAVGQGLAGAGREFRRYNIEVSTTASRTENLNNILSGFDQFANAATNATKTLSGQLAQATNRADELQESVGEKLAPAFVRARLAALEFAEQAVDFFLNTDEAMRKLLKTLGLFPAELAKTSDGFKSFTQEILSQVEAAEALGQKDEIALKLRNDQTKAIAEQQAIVDKLQQSKEKALAREVVNLDEVRAINQAIAKQQDTNLANEITKLNIIEDILSRQAKVRKEEKEVSDVRVAGSAKEIELIKALGAEYNDLLNLLSDPQKLQLFELASIAEIESASEIKDKIKILEDVLKENKIEIPVAIDAEEPIQDARLRFNQLKAALEAEGINIDISLDDLSLNNLKAEVAKLVIEMQKEIVIPLKLEVPEDRKFVTMNTGINEVVKSDLELWFERNEQILNSSVDLLNDLAALYDQYQQNRIDQINEERDIKLAALDTEQQSIDDQLKKRRLSETEAQKLTEELTAKRLATEAAAAKKEQALKKKQFDIDKAAALIQIIINTAEAVTAALTIPPPAGTILAALNAAAGAAEGALVAGQPNPYKKGTKSAKEGLALVDEEGTEAIYRGRLTTLEKGDKVLTAPKTKTYGAVLDSMIDNTFDRYIMKTYVAPVLEKQVKQDKAVKQKTFAQNITESLIINKQAGLTDYGLEKVWRKGNYVTNADDIGKSVARHLQKDIYR